MPADAPATDVVAPRSTEPEPSRTVPAWAPGLILGAIAALVGLDRSALWRDEAYSLGAVHQLGTTLRETRGTMAGHYVLLRAWTAIGSDSAVWMRLLSVVLGLAAIVVVVRFVERTVDGRTARWAGVALGLSLLWVAYAQEARSYTLVLLLTAVSWTAFDHVLTDTGRMRRRWIIVHIATAALLPLSQGLAALQIAGQAAALLAGRADRRTWRALAPGFATALAVTAALVALGTGEAGSWIAPVDAGQARSLVEAFTSTIAIIVPVLAGLALLGGWIAAQPVRPGSAASEVGRIRAIAPVTWAIVPPALLLAISLLGRPTLVPRYVMASAAGVAVLWAIAATTLDRRRGAHRAPVVGLIVVALLVVGQVRLHEQTGDDWRATARAVAEHSRDGDVILLATSEVRPPFEAAWVELSDPPTPPLVNGERPLGRVLRVDDSLTDAEARAAALDHDRVWVVGEERDPLRATAVDHLRDAGYDSVGRWAAEGGVPAELLVRR